MSRLGLILSLQVVSRCYEGMCPVNRFPISFGENSGLETKFVCSTVDLYNQRLVVFGSAEDATVGGSEAIVMLGYNTNNYFSLKFEWYLSGTESFDPSL